MLVVEHSLQLQLPLDISCGHTSAPLLCSLGQKDSDDLVAFEEKALFLKLRVHCEPPSDSFCKLHQICSVVCKQEPSL